jgi:hypothetical protein
MCERDLMTTASSVIGDRTAFERSNDGPPLLLVDGALIAPEVLAPVLEEFFAGR